MENRKTLPQIIFAVIRIIITAVLMVVVVFEIFASSYFMSSSTKIVKNAELKEAGEADVQFDASVSRIKSEALDGIYSIPKVYVLPISDSPAPNPNKKLFTSIPDDGRGTYKKQPIRIYEDETIRVEMWRERHDGSTYNFSKIKIAHPSQFRHAISDDDFFSSNRYKPITIAKSKNAVVAMTADFCKYRSYGVTIHNRKMLRNKPSYLELLLVDAEGDFHVVKGKKLKSSGILENNDIIFSLSFGPILVENGKPRQLKDVGYYAEGLLDTKEPRAAIGQLGNLEYLLCTVNGRMPSSPGVTFDTIAKRMAQKGCITAYNLDGGQTSTLIFNDKVYNAVAYGGQREVSDIIYFATAIPEGEE